MLKKFVSLVCSLVLAVSMVPAVAFAAPTAAQPDALPAARQRLDLTAAPAASVGESSETTAAAASVANDFVPAAKSEAPEGMVHLTKVEYQNPVYGDEGLTVTFDGYVPDARPHSRLADGFVSNETTNASSCMTVGQAAAVLRAALYDCKTSVSFTMPRNSDYSTMIRTVMNNAEAETANPFQGDYLRWGWGGYSGSYYTYDDYFDVSLTLKPYTTLSQEQYVRNRVPQILDSLGVAGKSDYEKCALVHDWIVRHVKYDFVNTSNDYKYKYTAYAALFYGTAVCQGFSRLYYAMAESAGVNSRVIAGLGNGGSHSWNISKMTDGYYYYVDSTWDRNRSADDKNNGALTYVHRDYFMLGEDVFDRHQRYGANGAYSSSSMTLDYTTPAFYKSYPMGSGKLDPNTLSSIVLAGNTANYSAEKVRVSSLQTTGSTGAVTLRYYRNAACTTFTGTTIETGRADVEGGAPRSAGTYYAKAWLASDGYHKAAVSNVVKIVINRVAMPVKATANGPYARYSTSQTKEFSAKPLTVKGNKANVTYTLVSAVDANGRTRTSRFSLGATKGKLKVKPETELGTYTLKIKVTAPGTKNYKPFSHTYTAKVRVLKATKKIVPRYTSLDLTYSVATSGAWRYMLSYDRNYTLKASLKSGTTSLPTSTLRYKVVSAVKTSNNKDMTSKFTITSKGVLTSHRGLMKGKYKVKVKITSCATSHYKAAPAKYVYVYVRVK